LFNPIQETIMAEHKGKGTKGRNYDELSGIGTSQAGVTGTTGNLNTARRDGGVGMPDIADAGNRQNADLGQHGDTPALGSRIPRPQSRQGGTPGSRSGSQADKEEREDKQVADNPNIQGGNLSR
jgi:hypothetical protein